MCGSFLCGQTPNARAILNDLRTLGDELWGVLQAGKRALFGIINRLLRRSMMLLVMRYLRSLSDG